MPDNSSQFRSLRPPDAVRPVRRGRAAPPGPRPGAGLRLRALGSVVANALVRAGVGKVRIVDRDFVELSNLQRQTLFDEQDVAAGLPKAVAAAEKLRKINSQVEIEPIVADLDYRNAEQLCAGVDVIVDGTDNFETRFLVNDVAVKHGIAWIYGGALGAEGQTMTILPGETPCLRCLIPECPAPGQHAHLRYGRHSRPAGGDHCRHRGPGSPEDPQRKPGQRVAASHGDRLVGKPPAADQRGRASRSDRLPDLQTGRIPLALRQSRQPHRRALRPQRRATHPSRRQSQSRWNSSRQNSRRSERSNAMRFCCG